MENEKIQPGDKIISDHIYDRDISQVLKKNWSYNFQLKTELVVLTTQPYRICRLKNFLKQPLGTYDLRGELMSVHNRKRGNDLMKLEESVCDLQDITPELTHSKNIECIKQLCSEFINDFRPWLSKITCKDLGKMSIRTSTYTDTDFLLCHNDQVQSRLIAFILYLSKDWTEDCGGQLNVFNSQNGEPTEVESSLLPEFNSLLFFEVTNTSFHSVSEILKKACRFSVNGWFHTSGYTIGPSIRSLMEIEQWYNLYNSNVNLTDFINESRLSNTTFLRIINSVLENNSFCGIKNYVKDEQYRILLEEIMSDKIDWRQVGPPDQRNYDIAEIATLPDNLRKFYSMFKTFAFSELLNRYSELQLVPNDNSYPKFTIELQRWHQGCYTVLHDGNVKIKNEEENEVVIEPEENEIEDAQPGTCRVVNGGMYTTKNMLQDIISNSPDISRILSSLPTSIRGKLEADINQPGPSSASDKDDEPGPSKRSRIESEGSDDVELLSVKSDKGSETNGTLDVVMYFHAANAPVDTTLDYVDPGREDGVFLTVPIRDNTLFIVFREDDVVRHNEYVNHYCKGHFYSLVCSYTE